MIIYGGINENGKVLDEFWLLSFEKNYWSKINDIITGEKIPSLCMHGMKSVFPEELYTLPGTGIFKHPDLITDVSNTRVLKIGV